MLLHIRQKVYSFQGPNWIVSTILNSIRKGCICSHHHLLTHYLKMKETQLLILTSSKLVASIAQVLNFLWNYYEMYKFYSITSKNKSLILQALHSFLITLLLVQFVSYQDHLILNYSIILLAKFLLFFLWYHQEWFQFLLVIYLN